MDMPLDAQRRRLAWGCRRGTLELDASLAGLAQRVESMPATELAAAGKLLELDDSELFELLILGSRKPEPELEQLVASLR